MERWRRYLDENEDVRALIDNKVLLIENKQVVGEKNFDVLCEEARRGILTEEQFFDILNEAAEHEWGLIEEDLCLEEGMDLQAIKKWGEEKWAQLKSAAIVKAFKFVINAINRVIKILADMLDTFGMTLYLGAMRLLGFVAKGTRKLVPYIGPGLWVLGAVLILLAAYSGTLEAITDQISSAAAAVLQGDLDPSQLSAAITCEALISEFQCGGEVIDKDILASAVDILTSDLYSNLGGTDALDPELYMSYAEQQTENSEVVKLIDYNLITESSAEANVTVDAIERLAEDLHDMMSTSDEKGRSVKLHWELEDLREWNSLAADKIEAAIEMATEMRDLDPEMADASAEAGSSVRVLWTGRVQSTFTDMAQEYTQTVGGEVTDQSSAERITSFGMTKGKDIPVSTEYGIEAARSMARGLTGK